MTIPTKIDQTMAEIVIRETANFYDVQFVDVTGRLINRDVCEARKMAMYILHCKLGYRIEDICNLFQRTRRCVYRSCEMMRNFIAVYEPIRSGLREIMKNITFDMQEER